MKQWVEEKVKEYLGYEDELVSGLIIGELEGADEKGPNPKKLQITIEGKFFN